MDLDFAELVEPAYVNVTSSSTASTAQHSDDSFMFIIGQVGSAPAIGGVKMSSKHHTTHIDHGGNPSEAIRQYNNTQRGTRPAMICVCIFVPGWRRLAVTDMVQLWHRSRKLPCRMRFGITMAYDLGLPCFVSPLALQGDASRRALPHIVARLDAEQAMPSMSEQSSDAILDDSEESTPVKKTPARRRGRRPSSYESSVTNHVVFGDLSADNVMRTVRAYVNVAAKPIGLSDDELDRLNSLTYNDETLCFTVGRSEAVAVRNTESARRQSRSQTTTSTPTDIISVVNSDDENDGEMAENDEDDEVSIASAKKPARVKRKKTEVAEDEAAVTAMRERNTAEVANYARTNTQPVTSVTRSPRLGERLVDQGVLDNYTLIERVDECFNDINDYIDRPLKRVRIERAQHCVCGARNSYKAGVCGDCHRTTTSVYVMRTNVSLLREKVTKRPSTVQDRREIRHLMTNAERDTAIDLYMRSTAEQLREALVQQEQQIPYQPAALAAVGRQSSMTTRVPKEMRFISAVLMQAVGEK
jgi:hypothetical protein